MKTKSVVIAVSLLALGACAPVDPSFGEAFRWDMAQQVIDPDPTYEGVVMEGGSGERLEGAVDRYNKGQVKEPVTLSTSQSSTGGGGSGSGAGSSSGSGPN